MKRNNLTKHQELPRQHTAKDWLFMLADMEKIGGAVSDLIEVEKQRVSLELLGESTPVATALRELANAWVVANNAMIFQCDRDTGGRPAHTIFAEE